MSPPRFDAAVLEALDRSTVRTDLPFRTAPGQVAWRRWGSGPALVLLHGSSGSWTHWAPCIPALALGRTVHVPDIPGMGDSDALPLPTTLQAIAAELRDGLARLLGPGARYDLAGFSFGTAVAGEIALQDVDAVRTLTLVAPGALGLPKTQARLSNWREAPDERSAREIHRRNLAALMFADSRRIDDLAVDIQQRNATRSRLKNRAITPPDALLPVFARLDPARVHAVIGERDVVAAAHMEERRRFFAAHLPDGHFRRIPGAGHWVMYEAPEALLEVLGQVLAGG